MELVDFIIGVEYLVFVLKDLVMVVENGKIVDDLIMWI